MPTLGFVSLVFALPLIEGPWDTHSPQHRRRSAVAPTFFLYSSYMVFFIFRVCTHINMRGRPRPNRPFHESNATAPHPPTTTPPFLIHHTLRFTTRWLFLALAAAEEAPEALPLLLPPLALRDCSP